MTGKSPNKELGNAKSTQNIWGKPLPRIVVIYPVKYDQKYLMFYLITYIAEFLCAGNSTNEELRNAKTDQSIWG